MEKERKEGIIKKGRRKKEKKGRITYGIKKRKGIFILLVLFKRVY